MYKMFLLAFLKIFLLELRRAGSGKLIKLKQDICYVAWMGIGTTYTVQPDGNRCTSPTVH